MMNANELVEKCVKRDLSSWNEFVKRYRHVIIRSVRYKFKQTGHRSSGRDVMDVVQDIFLSIWEKNKLSKLRDVSSLEGWLAMVSINMTSNHLRKNRKYQSTLSIDDEIFSPGPFIEKHSGLSNSTLDTEKNLEARDINNILEIKLKELPVKQHLALKLYILEQKKQKDISKIMNIPETTVATLIRRGKAKLRKELKPVF